MSNIVLSTRIHIWRIIDTILNILANFYLFAVDVKHVSRRYHLFTYKIEKYIVLYNAYFVLKCFNRRYWVARCLICGKSDIKLRTLYNSTNYFNLNVIFKQSNGTALLVCLFTIVLPPNPKTYYCVSFKMFLLCKN